MNFKDSENWAILNSIELSIKNKIEKYGTKLSDWDLSINRGILTGYNDAFIIDETTKNTLVASDPKSAELIRPILRGKDIKRYTYDFAKLWIIFIPCGFTNENKKYGIEPEQWFKETYPSLYFYLIETEETLSKNRNNKSKGLFRRDDKGDYWWELRSCKYLDDFYEQNIAWQRITHENTFCLTTNNMVILDSMAFINGAKDKTNYLLAVLNSTLVRFWIKKNVPEYGNSGYRLSNQFVTQIPIPLNPPTDYLSLINKYVEEYMKHTIFDAVSKIDDVVFKIYNLTDNEINYIKSGIYLNK